MGNSRVEIWKKINLMKAAIIKLFAINHEA